MTQYKLSNVAKEDLIRIYHYGVHRFGVKQADEYFDKIFHCFLLIEVNPYAFEAVDFIKPGYRRCVCGIDSIYYRINNDCVEIMTIIGRQDYP
jgi:toxin ParE1/3/4